jgi:hypothetical protein
MTLFLYLYIGCALFSKLLMDYTVWQVPEAIVDDTVDMKRLFHILFLIPVVNLFLFIYFLCITGYLIKTDVRFYLRMKRTAWQRKRLRKKTSTAVRRYIKAREKLKKIQADQMF